MFSRQNVMGICNYFIQFCWRHIWQSSLLVSVSKRMQYNKPLTTVNLSHIRHKVLNIELPLETLPLVGPSRFFVFAFKRGLKFGSFIWAARRSSVVQPLMVVSASSLTALLHSQHYCHGCHHPHYNCLYGFSFPASYKPYIVAYLKRLLYNV